MHKISARKANTRAHRKRSNSPAAAWSLKGMVAGRWRLDIFPHGNAGDAARHRPTDTGLRAQAYGRAGQTGRMGEAERQKWSG